MLREALRGWRLPAALATFALVALLSMQLFGQHGYLKLRQRAKELNAIQQDVQRLSDENKRIEERIRKLKSDPAAIEAIARQEMKLARPGEVVYTLPPSEKPAEKPKK
jgi:cell division protein FtsB